MLVTVTVTFIHCGLTISQNVIVMLDLEEPESSMGHNPCVQKAYSLVG